MNKHVRLTRELSISTRKEKSHISKKQSVILYGKISVQVPPSLCKCILFSKNSSINNAWSLEATRFVLLTSMCVCFCFCFVFFWGGGFFFSFSKGVCAEIFDFTLQKRKLFSFLILTVIPNYLPFHNAIAHNCDLSLFALQKHSV